MRSACVSFYITFVLIFCILFCVFLAYDFYIHITQSRQKTERESWVVDNWRKWGDTRIKQVCGDWK